MAGMLLHVGHIKAPTDFAGIALVFVEQIHIDPFNYQKIKKNMQIVLKDHVFTLRMFVPTLLTSTSNSPWNCSFTASMSFTLSCDMKWLINFGPDSSWCRDTWCLGHLGLGAIRDNAVRFDAVFSPLIQGLIQILLCSGTSEYGRTMCPEFLHYSSADSLRHREC